MRAKGNEARTTDEMGVVEMGNMLAASIETQITVTKHIGQQGVEVSGGTGVALMDLYLAAKALEALAIKVRPMMKSADALKDALKETIDLFDLGGEGEDERAESD